MTEGGQGHGCLTERSGVESLALQTKLHRVPGLFIVLLFGHILWLRSFILGRWHERCKRHWAARAVEELVVVVVPVARALGVSQLK